MQFLHKFHTGTGIHVSNLGTKVQIDKKSGFSAIHEIVWAKTCSCTSSAIISMH